GNMANTLTQCNLVVGKTRPFGTQNHRYPALPGSDFGGKNGFGLLPAQPCVDGLCRLFVRPAGVSGHTAALPRLPQLRTRLRSACKMSCRQMLVRKRARFPDIAGGRAKLTAA